MSTNILIGLAAGIALGLFVGDHASVLQWAADAYIKLLQMTVLPFVTVSIIGGLGALNASDARKIGVRVGIVLGLFWALALLAVCLFPLMFPPGENASFFSSTLLQEREPFDLVNLYIPANPFNSLANSVIPAVVLFSLVMGVALMAVPNKARLLDVLHIANAAILRATQFVVSLTPYGVFAIGAVVAGTLSFEDLQRLQVYLLSYGGMSLLLGLWVLPGLVASLTPVPYRALLSRTRDALMMAFMTTSLFAVLPLLTEQAKALLQEHADATDMETSATDVIVPASFNFPHTGKLLSLSFVLFAGWFADVRVPVVEYPRLGGAGLLAMFGNANAAIPYLLDLLRIPAATFRLFVTSGVVNARFGTLVAAVHTVAVAVLGTCAVAGRVRLDWTKLARFVVVTASLTVAMIGGTRLLLRVSLNRPYEKDQRLAQMELLKDRGQARVFTKAEDAPPLPPVTTSVLDRAQRRGTLRVGYLEDSLPYAFFNGRGELVGFDVEMAMQLAKDLGIGAEFVPVSRAVFERGLDADTCDLVMSGVAVTTDRAAHLQLSASYLDETVAFVVPDRLVAAFSEWSNVRAMGRLRMGVPRMPYFIQKVRDELGNVDVVLLDRMADAFVAHDPPLDAVMMTAERGSAYTLLHPTYSVAVPKPRPFKVPLAYPIAARDLELTSAVNTWIELKRKDGTIDELFVHWILGEDAVRPHPRWSVMRNVLHVAW
jgi:Na+/H+-dicarboxylate symporter